MINFSNKVALVTGGSRGIGAATVKAIVAAGGKAIIHYGSNRDAAIKTAAEVGQSNCHLVGADLNKQGTAADLWRDALAGFGQIDILINNAGVFVPADIDCEDDHWQDVWQQVLQVNLISTADLCRQAIKHWRSNKAEGAIVNVASRAAFRGDAPDQWAYAASKGAMISLTKTLARAYSADGIYTYAVAPGFTATDMALNAFDEDPDLRASVVRDIPIGDIAPASDVANAICFLASGLSKHTTGQTIDVNGASYVR